MADAPPLDPHPAFAIDETPRFETTLTLDALSASLVALVQRLHEQREELLSSRSAARVAVYDTRALLLGIADRVDKAQGLLRAAQRRGPQEGVPAVWIARIERLERAMAGLAQDAGLIVRRPLGHPQPGVDEIVDTIDSDSVPSGEIVEVLREGLLWRGEVLRRAEVTVAR